MHNRQKWAFPLLLVVAIVLFGIIIISALNSQNIDNYNSIYIEKQTEQSANNNKKASLLQKLNTDKNQILQSSTVTGKKRSGNIHSQKSSIVTNTYNDKQAINKSRFPNREVLQSEDTELLNGNILRTSLIEVQNFKYKKIKILETINPSTNEVIFSKEMVASHFLLKTKPQISKKELESFLSNTGLEVIKNLPQTNIYLVSSPANTLTSLEESIEKALDNQSITLVAEPDYIVYAISNIPNDTYYDSYLYGMDLIQAPEAWDISTGSKDIVVGVIDTGVNYNHPDLTANIWHNEGEDWNDSSPGNNGIDDDGNGYIDDYYGIDAYNDDSDPMDDNGHGSHCSGTIGGVGNNSIGVAGVNWNVSIMGLKFLSSSSRGGSTSDAISCINYATAMDIDLTSNSWGGGGGTQIMYETIIENGKPFIAAAGNSTIDNDDTPYFPSNYSASNVISVAATDSNDILAYFSNYGANTVDIAAPGVGILSTVLNSDYSSINGTSMACPHVAGAAALLLSVNPDADIKPLLMDNVDVISKLQTKCVTGGRLNIFKAIQSQQTTKTYSISSRTNGNVSPTTGSHSILPYSTFSITATADSGYYFKNWTASGPVTITDISSSSTNAVIMDDGAEITANFGLGSGDGWNDYTEELIDNEYFEEGTESNFKADDKVLILNMTDYFPIKFYGNEYSEIYISTNGFIDLSNSLDDYTNNDNDLKNNCRIAPFWSDLTTENGDIYLSINTERLYIRWEAHAYGGGYPVNVEVIINKNGNIQFNYGSDNSGYSPTIGISKGDGENYILVSSHNNNSNLSNAQSIVFNFSGSSNVSSDYNGDGKSDILLKHSGGLVGMWKSADSSKWKTIGGIGPQWEIAGSADFNGDGESDILLKYNGGVVGMWKSADISQWEAIGIVGSDWEIAGSADFNGDGESDILLKHSGGLVGMWKSADISQWEAIGIVGSDWEIAGNADFNGDGESDILLHNTSTGLTGMWKSADSSQWQAIGVAGSEWEIAGNADFNGDDESDILLHNTNTGLTGMWKSADTSQWQAIGIIGTDWEIYLE